MHYGHAQYLPIAPSLFALLAVALGILLILVQIRVLRYAYMQLGVSSGTAFFLLFGSLLGSYVNIPIAKLGSETMVTEREVTYYGMRYIVPALTNSPEVILAVNVGGAVIPTLLSVCLLWKNDLWGRGLIATAIIAAICHALAQPIRGVGIGLPISSPRWPRPSSPRWSPGATPRAGLCRRQPWRADRRGFAQSRQPSGPRRADSFHRRRWHLRRNFVTGMIAVLLAGFTGGGRRGEDLEAPRRRRRAW